MARKVKEPRQLAFDEIVRTPQATVSFAIDEFFPEELADELARQEAFLTSISFVLTPISINGGRDDAAPRFAQF